jgi:PAS domain-containing protein
MKDELCFNDVKKNLENSKLNPNKKQVYPTYNIELLSILKDAVIITDKNFTINYWNPAAQEIYGWKANEVQGKDVKEVLQTKLIENAHVFYSYFRNGMATNLMKMQMIS